MELLLVAFSLVDLRRRGGHVGSIWLRAGTMPVVNRVGLLGSLAERGRTVE